MTAALDGIRVVDLATSMAGAFCARLLGDLGADVVLVEPPAGHPLRALQPCADDGASIPAAYVHANKRSLLVDPALAADRATLLALLEDADLVVESAAAGALEAWGVGIESLRERYPDVVVVSVTPHGLTGGREARAGNDLTTYALSGWASINGRAGREPLKGSGFVGSFIAGASACGAALTALFAREGGAGGQRVDVAETEALLRTFQATFLGAQYMGRAESRADALVTSRSTTVPVKDGYIYAPALGRGDRWRLTLIALGLVDVADDPRWQDAKERADHQDELTAIIRQRLTELTRLELVEVLSALRVAPGPAWTVADLAASEHLRARGYFVRAEDDPDGPEWPGAPFVLSATPWRLRRRAPRPGEHAEEVRGELAARSPRSASERPARRSGPPLEGVRVLGLTHAWLGTFCAELLALNGAEVIQVEARRRPDVWRGLYDAPLQPRLQEVPTARHPWNCSRYYNSVNLNKQAITLDLQTEEGNGLFRRLIPHVDVVVENFSSRVMETLGLGYESLRALRPDLIMVGLSAYGHTGPWRDVTGFGATIEPASGMSSLMGYADGPPMSSGEMIADTIAAYFGYVATLAALRHRARTGEGQLVDLSMQEANHACIGDAALEYLATGRVRPRMGNRHMTFAPHGIFPALGEDRWVALAAESEEQWRALCELAGRPHWLSDPRFATPAARKANEDALDEAIREWTATLPPDVLEERLAAAGLPAAAVRDAYDLERDPVFRERGAIVEVTHPEAGTWPQVALPYRFERTPTSVTRPSPCLGEHSFEVLSHLLGMKREEYEHLERMGVTGEGPPPGWEPGMATRG